MADSRFFPSAGPFTIARVAEAARADLPAQVDLARAFAGVAPLETAGPDDVSYLENRRYAGILARTRAGACIVAPHDADRVPVGTIALLSKEPQRAFARLAAAFFPEPRPAPGIHPRAIVDASARLADGVVVEAGAVIGAGAEIGAGAWIEPNAVIGVRVVIGAGARIGPNASVAYAIVGQRSWIYAGARIGQDGFGIAVGAKGHLRVPQLGRVIIGDDVEIGANCTIDRGAMDDTVIGDGAQIDNMVHIGHNVRVGRGCIIAAQSGIAGSTRLDELVFLGGQVGLAGHIHVGAGAQIAAKSGVMRDVPAGEAVMGYPSLRLREFLRLAEKWRRQARRMSQGSAPAAKDED